MELLLDQPLAKRFVRGTHRIVSPAETLVRARRLMPVLGITRIANVTGLDTIGLPVVMVCRPNGRSLSVGQGKGLDLDAARASGLMESIESYHAEQIQLPLKLASYEDLRYSHRVVDVSQLPQVAQSRFHTLLPILWIEGFDLIGRVPIWLPFDSVHTNYTLAMRGLQSGFVCSSNGLASGNHLLEAISHGLCELIERDAQMLWNLREEAAHDQTRIDLRSVDDPDCRSVLDRFEQADLAVAVWDMTSDCGLPTYRCRIIERNAHPLRPLFAADGAGCHPVRTVALLRALTEAAQSRLTVIAGSRDDCFRSDYARLADPLLQERIRARMAITPGQRSFRARAEWVAETFNEDITWILRRLAAVGLHQAIVVNLTRAEFGIPVVRIVVPGLEQLQTQVRSPLGQRGRSVWKGLQ